VYMDNIRTPVVVLRVKVYRGERAQHRGVACSHLGNARAGPTRALYSLGEHRSS
jgi:hypothetical protein